MKNLPGRFTLLMRAEDVPEGTTVRKPTGEKQYVLRKELKIHDAPTEQRPVITYDGCYFLMHTDGINVITKDRLLAVDFPGVHALHEWVEEHCISHQ